jgi:hypothetical protein
MGDEIKKKSSLKLLSQSQPNFAEMILGWSPFKIVSVSTVLYPSSNLGTFWRKIEQFWPFEEISIFSNGGHLGYRTALTDTILKGDHPRFNCVRQHCLVSKMAAITKNRNFFKWPKLLYFTPESAEI